jgi:hypothetical protein
MRLRLLRFLALAGLVAAAVGSAGACEAPRIPQDRINAIVRSIGAGSYQADPSVLVARLTFTDPAAAPAVETVFAGGDSRYSDGLIAEAKQLRLPCVTAAAPVVTVETHRVGARNSGLRAAEPRLKPELQLAELLRLVKDLKSQQVKFDMRAMSCPFNLRFGPFRPYMQNSVEEVGASDPRRAPLIEWLRNVTLAIPKDMMVTAIGRDSLVAVPCAVLDLS